MSKYITTYATREITFTHGIGAYLYKDNNEYLDAIAGIGSCSLGHTHPKVTAALCDQANKFIHCSNMFNIEWQNTLAKKLCSISGMQQVFFTNSGTEAIETALKCIRLYANQQGISDPKIIVTDGAFHGRTFGAISASNTRTRADFSPLLPGFIHVPYDDIDAITKLSSNKNIVGILVEPIQGENGIIIPSHDYLTRLRKISLENKWILALDEIQTGIGRTGNWFEYMNHDIVPDIVTSAKALGNGIPIGACLLNGPCCDLLKPGMHGSTFGGNPLTTRVSCTVLDAIEKENILSNVLTMGEYLLNGLQNLKHPAISEIRGKGLMLAIEMDRSCKELVDIGIENNLLINVTADRVVRLLPPLIINKQQVDLLLQRLQKTLNDWSTN